MLSLELERTSCRSVLKALKGPRGVAASEAMVGPAVAKYLQKYKIAAKVAGKEAWTADDKAFNFEAEDGEDRPYFLMPKERKRRKSQQPLAF